MRVSVLSLFCFFMVGCGVESQIPSMQDTSPSSERAVAISKIEITHEGSIVTCDINDALVSESMEIPLFLEYEGTMIERVILENQNSYTFEAYSPPVDGSIVCVVELANAEFESEEAWLTR